MDKVMKLPHFLMVFLMVTSIFGYGSRSKTLEFRIRQEFRILTDLDPQHWCIRISKQCCGSRSVRIQTFLVGSGRLWPDTDPGLNKWLCINFFWAYVVWQKKVFGKSWPKFIRVRIRIRKFPKGGSRWSEQKPYGSATLSVKIRNFCRIRNVRVSYVDPGPYPKMDV
jgi:hypothetical protein